MNNTDRKLLVECITFDADPRLLHESTEHPNQPFRVQGVLQRKGRKNQNNRVYPDEILIREADKYARTFIAEHRAMGELDHPESSVVNLKNVSHNVIEMRWQGDDLVGTVEVLTTPNGNILRELFRNGIKLGISSRGLGTLKKINETAAVVGDDYELISFDFVSNPSVRDAFMTPVGQIPLAEGVVRDPLTNKWAKTDDIVKNILFELN